MLCFDDITLWGCRTFKSDTEYTIIEMTVKDNYLKDLKTSGIRKQVKNKF